MRINVSQLLKETIGSMRNCQVDAPLAVMDDGKECPVRGEVRLLRTDRAILVEGTLHTEVEITCSRCLSLYNCPLSFKFNEEYFPTVDVETGASLDVPDDPACFTIDKNHVLDLSEAVRQYALIGIPMKPLCREDCAGLCSACGANLNMNKCDCSSETIDPRWLELAKLVSEQKGEK